MIKILLDSSAWIHFFKKQPAYLEYISDLLEKDWVVTCGPVITEVLRGVRIPKEREFLKDHFMILDCLDLQKEDFYQSAELGSKLAGKGFTVKTIDLLIAHLAIKNHLPLLHDDGDFEFIARHTPLKAITPL